MLNQLLNRMEGEQFYPSTDDKTSTDSDISGENDSEREYGFGCYITDDGVDIDNEDDGEGGNSSDLDDALRSFTMEKGC